MHNYVIRQNSEPIKTHASVESDMRFALAEWLFAEGHDLEAGEYVKTDNGFSIQVNGRPFEIQSVPPTEPDRKEIVEPDGHDAS